MLTLETTSELISRRIFKLGTSFVFNLPKEWIEKKEMKKGSIIELRINGKKITISKSLKQKKTRGDINLRSILEIDGSYYLTLPMAWMKEHKELTGDELNIEVDEDENLVIN